MKIDTYDAAVLERIREVCQELFHENYITEYVFAPNEALKKANDSFSFVTAHYDAIEELLEPGGSAVSDQRVRPGKSHPDKDRELFSVGNAPAV